MKRALGICAAILSAVLSVLYCLTAMHQYDWNVVSCIHEEAAGRAATVISPDRAFSGAEDMRMQIIYQLARRSIVGIRIKDAAGSGILWRVDDGIVVASSRHLLMKDVAAEVSFFNGETAKAEILGYSQQYDIGFLKVPQEEVSPTVIRDIFEAVPFMYGTESEDERDAFISRYAGVRVLQVGAAADRKAFGCTVGSISAMPYVPLFNTHMLETECSSRAGMSGGGVFDEMGRLVGMICGGDVPEDALEREAERTYSIPPALIGAEYDLVMIED